MGVKKSTFRGRDGCTLRLEFHGLSIAKGLSSISLTKDDHCVEKSILNFLIGFFSALAAPALAKKWSDSDAA